ncbi:hypothetical protein P4T20_17890 [Aneurinibacillus thermoaerophilus]|uniref:hypothetical protein n=1 Tax=Aneurinibacillus thermoaerophilus TaxID=143495 RepID=UPI000AE841FA|nr:hypothetical protein [Aneurinibacillus thermoaerophilus]
MNKLKNKSLLTVGEAGILSDGRVVTSRVWFMNPIIFCYANKENGVVFLRVYRYSYKFVPF